VGGSGAGFRPSGSQFQKRTTIRGMGSLGDSESVGGNAVVKTIKKKAINPEAPAGCSREVVKLRKPHECWHTRG